MESIGWIKLTIFRPEGAGEAKKEYKGCTILSFIGTDGVIRELNGNGNYRRKGFGISYPIESMLSSSDSIEDGMQKIHSVRREKDGEIFTLGDKVFMPSDSSNIQEIKGIEIDESFISKIGIWVNEIEKWGIMYAKKAPPRKPILRTEDGVEIFEGDQCCFVGSDWNYGAVSKMNINVYEDRKYHCKFLSTLERAQEYIKWNKPMYSLNEISWATLGNKEVLDMIQGLIKE